ncbi:MAG: hypothetical protein R3208_18255 [Ketobacteraceae bacterium]|nr:hypothetical protein [Ketobacteraceae bacterium]
MIRMVLFVLAFTLAGASAKSVSSHSVVTTPGAVLLSSEGPETSERKNKKDNKLQEEFEKALEPLIVFRNAIEAHLPQKEINAIKRTAFRILLIARRYL